MTVHFQYVLAAIGNIFVYARSNRKVILFINWVENASPAAMPISSDTPQCVDRNVLLQELWFGKFFSDHMLMASHSEAGGGWGAPAIRPFADLSLHPASPGLHYGLACFEGMKAFRGDDGVSRMFRPEAHAARLRRSAARLMLADFSEVQLLACMAAMLRLDAGWLPAGRGYSLYIRPLLFASDAELGVHRPRATRLLVISSPTGPYFAGGAGKGSAAAQGAEDGKGTAAAPPLRLLLDESTVRAWPGGVGEHKVAGNYAATVAPQVRRAGGARGAVNPQC